jgi:hypothetical protein
MTYHSFMSIEAHPNVNAAGLTAELVGLVVKHARGEMAGTKALTPRVKDLITSFVLILSETLNLEAEYGDIYDATEES